MTRLLDLNFAFDMNRKRFKLLHHPDILLISCVVFTTKLLFPLDGKARLPVSYRDPSSLQIDWSKWMDLMRDASVEGLERRDILKLQSEDVWTLSDRKIDDYLDWYEETQIKSGRETQEMRELFPLAQRQHHAAHRILTDEEIDDRLQAAQSFLASMAPSLEGHHLRTGVDHAIYRSVDDLSELARAFYGKAAELSGMSLGKLVKAVHALEQSISRWSAQEKKIVVNTDVERGRGND